MFGQILRNTKMFWGMLLVLLAFFLLVTAYGGRRIYVGEKNGMQKEVDVKLKLTEELLKGVFAELAEELHFLRSQPLVGAYAAGGFVDQAKRRDLQQLFHDLILTHKSYRKIVVVDKLGRELVRVDGGKGGKPLVIEEIADNLHSHQFCLASIKEYTAGHVCAISATLDDGEGRAGKEPGLIMSTGLGDEQGQWQGILTLWLGLDPVLSLLPPDTFIQMKCKDGGYQILSQNDNLPAFASLNFVDDKGVIPVSDTRQAHYVKVDILDGEKIVIAMMQDTRGLKVALLQLTLIFLAILSGFFGLVAVLNFSRNSQLKELVEAQRTIVFSLANLSEWRDYDTGQHLERTRNFGVLLTRELGKNKKYAKIITDEFLNDMYDAAPLHDLGKVGVPDEILLKKGKLTDAEYTRMKRHVEMGREIIQGVIDKLDRPEPFLLMSRNIAHCHHEKYDGTGYGQGLKGEEIPLEARIYALCDAYDAIRSRRPYKEPITHIQAVNLIFIDRGKHFDPDVVNAFLDCEEEVMEIYETHMLYDGTFKKVFPEQHSPEVAVAWSADFKIGIELIDEQHHELISRINSLYKHILEGAGKEETVRVLLFLKDYVVEHFATEEDYMQAHAYSDYARHKRLHAEFMREFHAIYQQLEREGISSELVMAVNKRLVEWLVAHIYMVDKGIVALCEKNDG